MKNLLHRIFILFLILYIPLTSIAQDTVWVETLNFEDITKRKGTFSFPDADQEWSKVLMHYTLKCDPRTTRDNFECGEWDYLSYTIVHDSTGIIDSNRLEHPNFKIGDLSPESFSITKNPPSDLWKGYQYFKTVSSVNTAKTTPIGSPAGVNKPILFGGRTQYLYTAKELNAAGVDSGSIEGLSFIFSSVGSISDLHIKAAFVADTTISKMSNVDFRTVFHGDFIVNNIGPHLIQFLESLNFDGASSLLIELTAGDNSTGNLLSEMQVSSSQALGINNGEHLYEATPNGFLELQNTEQIFNNIDSVVTISFWCKGDESLPLNTSILEGRNAAGVRIINIHHPWNNSRVYWDAGNDGSDYDRIDKAATAAEIKDQWNHWAFVKNAKTGSMKIYLNGSLWHSGTAKNKSMSGITEFRIGKGTINYQYRGKLDDIAVWNTELSATTIAQWKDKKIESNHPNYSDLVFHFGFENPTALPYTITASNNASIQAYQLGVHGKKAYEGTDLTLGATAQNEKPILEIYQADQTTQLDSIPWIKPLSRKMYSIAEYTNSADPTIRTNIDYGYESGFNYSYDPQGQIIDSTGYPAQRTLTRSMNPYYEKFEVVNNVEIARYITPYGIGLDLGPDGFRWIYDVTDYASLLTNDVTLTAGNQQELIDLKFEFIKGTPSREVKKIDYYINRNSKKYKDIADDLQFTVDTFAIHPEATTHKLITRITGHGHNGNSTNGQIHCCEWADKEHELLINGKSEFKWDIWQDDACALNPVSDQGGNWAPPRAGWCPGAPVPDYNFELTPLVKGNEISIDYEIEAVPDDNIGQGDGNYVVSMHLVQYGDINFKNDAEIIDIISPTNWEYHLKQNPTCAQPKIVLKNRGSENLKGVLIRYGVVGGNPIEFYWQGDLAFEKSEIVDLPFQIWDYLADNKTRKFYAEIVETNGKKDEYTANDRYETHFEIPRVATSELEVMYKNNDIADAIVTITNQKGEVVFENLDAQAGILNRETIYLNPGCYKLECVTENGFGLNYPLIPEVSGGILRLRHPGGLFTQSFNPDFGKSLTYYFTVTYGLKAESNKLENQLEVFPNPSQGEYVVLLNDIEATSYQILDAKGKILIDDSINANTPNIHVNLGPYSSGIFILQVMTTEGLISKKLIKN